MIKCLRIMTAIAFLLALGACSANQASFNFTTSDIEYNKAAQALYPDRNPIIVVPGILGSKLVDVTTGELVWGGLEDLSIDPGTDKGLRQLALPIGDGKTPLSKLGSSLRPAGVLDKAHVSIAGLPAEYEIYSGILATLGAGGYVDSALGEKGALNYGSAHFTCFQFSYDWRRDIVESARELGRLIRQKREFVRAQIRERFATDRPALKFDIIAHSMGALVVRYYLMYGDAELPADGSLPALTWAGARDVSRVIYIAPPNAGAAISLLYLVDGRYIGPMSPLYPSALLATYPAAYQLLPRPRHNPVVWDRMPTRPVGDFLDADLWSRMGWSLDHPKRADVLAKLMPEVPDADERGRRAAAFQAQLLERARRFFAAMDRPASPPTTLKIYTVIGGGSETVKTLAVGETGALRVKEHGAGDDTVLRSSVLLDERVGSTWKPMLQSPLHHGNVTIIGDDHLGVTRNPAFRDSVLYWLLEEPRNQP